MMGYVGTIVYMLGFGPSSLPGAHYTAISRAGCQDL